jgi:hypothetical protein
VELNAAQKTPLEFGRSGANEWQILKPKPMRADGGQVDDLIQKLKSAVMFADEDPKKTATQFAAGQPVATARVTGAEGVLTMEVRKVKDDYFAKSSMIDGFYKINQDSGSGLAKSLDDFRNKKLFDFGFTDPTRIEYKDSRTGAVYEKSGDKWTSGGKTMDSVTVQNLIDKLRDASATKFVESGFTTPAIELTVVSNDGKRTEKVQIAAAGSDFLARREGDATLYQLTGISIMELRQAAEGVKEPAPAANEKKK